MRTIGVPFHPPSIVSASSVTIRSMSSTSARVVSVREAGVRRAPGREKSSSGMLPPVAGSER